MASSDQPGLQESLGNPLGVGEAPGPSPEQQRAIDLTTDRDVRDRLAKARMVGPSIRQQTQSETLSMELLLNTLGNPFSTRRIPFSVMRDMAQDPVIAFALFYTTMSLIRADWSYKSPSAKLAAAADAAWRPIHSKRLIVYTNTLRTGYQPAIKRFKLGQLSATYRDPHAENPDEDQQVWDSPNVDALLPDVPVPLPPENCIPRWDENGAFNGFIYSQIPIPNPMLVGSASVFGEAVLTGYQIPLEQSLWLVNEAEQVYGSIFGQPRLARAYRYWWSYWFRWALADRSYENKADPPLIAYFPTDVVDAIDSNDPNLIGGETPSIQGLRALALQIAQQIRSGTRVAVPGDFVQDETGKTLNTRKWAFDYLEGKEHFTELDATFHSLDVQKMRAMLVPENALLEGLGSRGGSTGGSTRNLAAQMAQVFLEAQQGLADEYDWYHNTLELPQWVAANFPELASVPIYRESRGFSTLDTQMITQIMTLLYQQKGSVPPVDGREMLRQAGIPLLSKSQYDAELKRIAETAAAQMPVPQAPTPKTGAQGYNAGIERSEMGIRYVEPPGQIYLAADGNGFLSSLPDVPAYKDPAVRSLTMRIRRLLLDRYRAQVKSAAQHVSDRATLRLAQPAVPPPQASQPQPQQSSTGILPAAAVGVAATLVSTWAMSQVPAAEIQLIDLLSRVLSAAGSGALKAARLDPSVFDAQLATGNWAKNYARDALSSMDETVRSEVQTFLVDELVREDDPAKVSTALEEHFDEVGMPETHAARAVRTTVADAFNHGALSAYQAAGIQQVIAHDASDGSDALTDRTCLARNGRVLRVDEALQERLAHPNAIMEDTEVVALGATLRGYASHWRGPVVRLTTRMGNHLTVGPNHPILTQHGWMAAKFVNDGDYVVNTSWCDDSFNTGSAESNLQQHPALIQDVLIALRKCGTTTTTVPTSTHFHGDGNSCQGEINVIDVDCLLGYIGDLAFVKKHGKSFFMSANNVSGLPGALLAPERSVDEFLLSSTRSSTRVLSGDDAVFGVCPSWAYLDSGLLQNLSESLVAGPHGFHDLVERFASCVSGNHGFRVGTGESSRGAHGDTMLLEVPSQCRSADPHRAGDGGSSFTSKISLDRIIKVERFREFDGQAFDLQTTSRAYWANNILVHNCTLYFSPLQTESLSINFVDEIPVHLGVNGDQAAYDEVHETLYVLSTASEGDRRAYVLALGESLAVK